VHVLERSAHLAVRTGPATRGEGSAALLSEPVVRAVVVERISRCPACEEELRVVAPNRIAVEERAHRDTPDANPQADRSKRSRREAAGQSHQQPEEAAIVQGEATSRGRAVSALESVGALRRSATPARPSHAGAVALEEFGERLGSGNEDPDGRAGRADEALAAGAKRVGLHGRFRDPGARQLSALERRRL